MIWLARMRIDHAVAHEQKFKDCYGWHKAVWQVFPSMPDDDRCFLFRWDKKDDHSAVLVLATKKPVRPEWCEEKNWSLKELSDSFFQHSHYRFDLRANVIKRDKARDTYGGREAKGRKFVVAQRDGQHSWLARKGSDHGFKLHEEPGIVELEIDHRQDCRFSHEGKKGLVVAVDFRGVLEVTDSASFKQMILSGLGSARGLGFGLMLIQPVQH